MQHNSINRPPIGALLIGVAAMLVLGIVFAKAANSGGSVSTSPTGYPTPSEQASATSQLPPEKATLEQVLLETRQAATQTPYTFATVWPTPSPGPTGTPDLSGVPHRQAGAGVIISDTAGLPEWPIAVYNVWYEIPAGLQVFAGATADPEQGAVAVLTAYTDMSEPELYLTPVRAGMVEIIDAQGERLVLRTLGSQVMFYFDIPTRQFVDSLTATTTAPTVTPLPTFTPTPTLAPFTPIPSPTQAPYPAPSQAPTATVEPAP